MEAKLAGSRACLENSAALGRGLGIETSGFRPGEIKMTYDNVFAMLEAVKAHHAQHGHRLRCSDDPMRRTLGFCTDEGPDEEWQVSLTVLKGSMAADPERGPLLRELFTTTEGRLRLAESINQGQSLL